MQSRAYVERVVTQLALTLAVNDIYVMYAAIFILLIPIVWFARPPFLAKAIGDMH